MKGTEFETQKERRNDIGISDEIHRQRYPTAPTNDNGYISNLLKLEFVDCSVWRDLEAL